VSKNRTENRKTENQTENRNRKTETEKKNRKPNRKPKTEKPNGSVSVMDEKPTENNRTEPKMAVCPKTEPKPNRTENYKIILYFLNIYIYIYIYIITYI